MGGGWARSGAYRTYARAGFRRYSQYRAATIGGAITNSMFGLLRANILLATLAASATGVIGGYDARQATTFAWLGQAVLSSVFVFTWNELALRVRTGDIAIDLARPIDLQLSWLAADLGRAAFMLLPRGLPPLLFGALITGLELPRRPMPWLLGLVSLTLAVTTSFACRFVVNLLAFWFVEIRGLIMAYVITSNACAGLIVPVQWFPDAIRTALALTPFPSMVQAPIDVISGHVEGLAAWQTVLEQFGWAFVMLVLGRVVLHRGQRRLVIQGG